VPIWRGSISACKDPPLLQRARSLDDQRSPPLPAAKSAANSRNMRSQTGSPVRHIWVPQRMRPPSLAPQELEKWQSKSLQVLTPYAGPPQPPRAHNETAMKSKAAQPTSWISVRRPLVWRFRSRFVLSAARRTFELED
jgi:hypothetical protein